MLPYQSIANLRLCFADDSEVTVNETKSEIKGAVTATLGFMTRAALLHARAHESHSVDLRAPAADNTAPRYERVACTIHDARAESANLGLESGGFALFRRATAVRDWFDEDEVKRVYYEECKALACEISGAAHAFTFDHLIREPGKQTAGGGLQGRGGERVTGVERGGGYVGGVHMDYTEHAHWTQYLALHGIREPQNAQRVVVFNFWRSLGDVVEDNPLAVCDARTVRETDLLETTILGYGHPGYSWHDIGVAVYDVAAAPGQRWYYYSKMTRDEVLIMKSYDSTGVIGRASPHASFMNPTAAATRAPSRSGT